MISTLIEMLGNFYASNDLANVEILARSIQSAVPRDQVSLLFLGLTYYKTGRAGEALKIFNQAGASGTTKSARLTSNEDDNLTEGDSAAAACYAEATRRSPMLARLWCDLGAALLELRNLELAIPAFHSSLKAQPNDKAYQCLGQIYRRRRNFGAARECFAWVRKLRGRFGSPTVSGEQMPRHLLTDRSSA